MGSYWNVGRTRHSRYNRFVLKWPLRAVVDVFSGCMPAICVSESVTLSQVSSTCHERTPSGPGKSVRTRQVVARRRDGWAALNVIGTTPCTTTSPPAIFLLNTMPCIVIIMYAIVIEPTLNAS